MIATSLLYLQSKFGLAGMNTRGSVVVPVDVFYYSATRTKKDDLEQMYGTTLCAELWEVIQGV
jgi:hypothetical protein